MSPAAALAASAERALADPGLADDELAEPPQPPPIAAAGRATAAMTKTTGRDTRAGSRRPDEFLLNASPLTRFPALDRKRTFVFRDAEGQRRAPGQAPPAGRRRGGRLLRARRLPPGDDAGHLPRGRTEPRRRLPLLLRQGRDRRGDRGRAPRARGRVHRARRRRRR